MAEIRDNPSEKKIAAPRCWFKRPRVNRHVEPPLPATVPDTFRPPPSTPPPAHLPPPRHTNTSPLPSSGSALREQGSVSAAPAAGGGGGGGSPAPPAYTNFSGTDHLSQLGEAGAGVGVRAGAGAGRGGADGNSPVLERRATATAASVDETSRARSPVDRLLPTAAASGAAGTQAPEVRAAGGGVGGGGGGGNGAGGLGLASAAGLRSTVPPPPRRAVQSVASAGGDRLQRLAMAEIGFAEKELYAPKTGEVPRPAGRGGGEGS